MIPVSKLAWVGAILDMKGSIIHKKNQMRRTPQLVLMVETKQIDVVRELSKLTGTNAELQKPRTAKDFMRRACSDHCPEAHVHQNDNWQMPAIARWTITGAGAGIVLHSVMPYMVTDRGFTEMMRDTLKNAVIFGQGAGATMVMVKRLYSLGWELPPEISAKLIQRVMQDGPEISSRFSTSEVSHKLIERLLKESATPA